jgi:magnesium transporter
MRRNRSLSETAAAHLSKVVTAMPDTTVADLLSRLAAEGEANADIIYLVSARGKLMGQILVQRLLTAPASAALSTLMSPPIAPLPLDTDQERVGLHAVKHHASSVPIVDHDGHFVGVVAASALLRILHHEHVEDLHRLAGIARETSQARHSFDAPSMQRARTRLPWLLVGLLGSSLATWVMSAFERTLEARLAVVFFVPGIVYLADAIGTQTEAIAVRFLSLSHTTPFRRVLGGEVRTGLLIGAVLGTLALGAVAWAFNDARLGVAVALSIFCAGGLATTVGLLFPWALARAGLDPAFGSGPLATIVQDVLTLLVYFLIVSALVE